MDSLLVASIITLAVTVFSAIVILRQQRTIDRLTDKLMARDYGEYKRLERNVEREEKPNRKPLSWHDDPSVELEQ